MTKWLIICMFTILLINYQMIHWLLLVFRPNLTGLAPKLNLEIQGASPMVLPIDVLGMLLVIHYGSWFNNFLGFVRYGDIRVLFHLPDQVVETPGPRQLPGALLRLLRAASGVPGSPPSGVAWVQSSIQLHALQIVQGLVTDVEQRRTGLRYGTGGCFFHRGCTFLP